MLKVLSVDSGKYATKAIIKLEDGDKKIIFRTKMDSTMEEKSADKRSCVMVYNDDRVLIGETAETVDYDKTKAKKIHKYCTYSAIAQLVENGDEVILTIGCPLSIFNNVEERNQYKKYMHDKGELNIKINGNEKTFTIKKVIVCPESSGIVYKNTMKYKGKLIGVIDIGGLNTNCSIYDNLAPIKSTCFTTNLGANIMRNELKQHLNSIFPEINLQDWQMEYIIKDGFIKSNKEESKKIIKDFLQKHINNIIGEAKRKGWDINNIDFIFVGGGSKLLEGEIKNVIPDAEISDTAEWDNVEGFNIIGALNV